MNNNQSSVQKIYSKISRWIWILFGLAVLSVIGLFFILSLGDLPTLHQLENPKSELASEVFAEDGSTLGRYYVENRVAIPYAKLNPHLVDALLSTEDERFYQHSGIDWFGLTRAVVKLGKDGGASTITQQLAKQMFTGVASLSFSERILQKLKEWIIAIRLERNYTKEEIIAMYLNIFEFNYGAFGIQAASEIYFGKTQEDLSIQECAMLIGMLKSPSLYSPNRNPKQATLRREVVLKQMVKNNKLSETEYDTLRKSPLHVVMQKQTHVDGPAPYFRMELRKELRRILKDPSISKADGTPYDINRDGLKIFTTIDIKMQKLAEEAAWEHMKEVQKTYRQVWKSKDEWTFIDNRGTDEETTPAQLAFRQRKLLTFIRASGRYESIRDKNLNSVLKEISNTYDGWEIKDRDIDRLLAQDAGENIIRKLKRTKSIGKTLETRYLALLNHKSLWPKLKKARQSLDKDVDKVFTKPVKMKVFAYNLANEADTILSPLDSIKYMRTFLQIGSLGVDPHTGYVKTWVGGVSHKWFPFDHVQIRRQVGSTFKPFVYATVIAQQGISPCFRVADLPQTIRVGEGNFRLNDHWAPNNSDGKFTGEYLTLMDALKKSKNTVSVYLMKQLGDTEPVRGLVHNMGIDSSARYPSGRLVVPKSPSISLGSTDLSVEEMTGAYTTWANNGVYVKPILVKRIEDNNGKVLFQAIPEERTALDPVSNYSMVRMLQHAGQNSYYFGGVTTEYGGKTGTTNDYVDGWYMGVTPNLVVGTWVGGDERFIRFLNIRYGQGGYMARPFFAKFLKKLEDNADAVNFKKGATFKIPNHTAGIEFDCSKVTDGYAEGDALNSLDSLNNNIETPDENEGFGEDNGFGDEDPFGDEPFGDESFGDEPFGDEKQKEEVETKPTKVDTTDQG